jgi:hypothetical protein
LKTKSHRDYAEGVGILRKLEGFDAAIVPDGVVAYELEEANRHMREASEERSVENCQEVRSRKARKERHSSTSAQGQGRFGQRLDSCEVTAIRVREGRE